ncbi:MAG: DUF4862 family protein [Succinivibrio sp.]|nr:DUF4862 family protein [Succinivibrio sp.]
MTGFIIGAYPSAPSFYYLDEEDESKFFRLLSDREEIGGLEQPCLKEMHPLGNEFLFSHIPEDWKIVCTAVMYTMGQRKDNPGFGLASTDEEGRKACVRFHRHILEQMNTCTARYGSHRFSHLEIQSAPLKNCQDADASTEAFLTSLKEILSWDWPCKIVIEHCDDMHSKRLSKGFLPLLNEIAACRNKDLGICINWARSVLEADDIYEPLKAIAMCKEAGVLKGLMFSGTATGGSWGDHNDNHVPFAPFADSRLKVEESLLTVERARDCIQLAGNAPEFIGAKLMEYNRDADFDHRIGILLDGVDALNLAQRKDTV